MTVTSGIVQDVTLKPLGSELADPVTAGAAQLSVADGSDFAEGGMVRVGVDGAAPDTEAEATVETSDTGGLLRIGGEDPAAQVLRYETVSMPDDDDDLVEDEVATTGVGVRAGYGGAFDWDERDAGWALPAADPYLLDDDLQGDLPTGPSTITLAPRRPDDPPYVDNQLAQGWDAGTRVDAWDTGTNAPVAQWRALVRAITPVDATDTIDAELSYPVAMLLPEGLRDEDSAEVAILDDATGDWRVIDVAGRVDIRWRIAAWTSASTQTVPAGGHTTLTGWALDTTSYSNPAPYYSTGPGAGGSPAGTITMHLGGLYWCQTRVQWTAIAAGTNPARRGLRFAKNGDLGGQAVALPDSQGNAIQQLTQIIDLAVGDTLAVDAFHNAPIGWPLAGPHYWTIMRLGPS